LIARIAAYTSALASLCLHCRISCIWRSNGNVSEREAHTFPALQCTAMTLSG
jgi:hypothetical protein